MRFICPVLVALMAAATTWPIASAEQLTSTCRITAVDAAAHTVTLVRKSTTGEKSGVAKVAATAKITLAGKAGELSNLTFPLDATVVYDTEQRAVVEITIAAGTTPTGSEPPLAVAPFDSAKAKEYQKAWAKYLGVPVETTNTIGMKLVLIPPGEFEMGSTEADVANLLKEAQANNSDDWYIARLPAESPKHRVRITKPFWLGVHEVTRGQFQRFVDNRGYKTEAERDGKGGHGFIEGQWKQDPRFVWNRDPGFAQAVDHPVVNVSWNDVTEFCVWLSEREGKTFQLPSEAQWEYACRAGTSTAWYSSDDVESLKQYGWFGVNSEGKTHAVGQKWPNAWGLYDMHGNVWEWCQDWFGDRYYATSPPEDPPGAPAGSSRVSRGSSWYYPAGYSRSANRACNVPGDRGNYLGFRVSQVLADK